MCQTCSNMVSLKILRPSVKAGSAAKNLFLTWQTTVWVKTVYSCRLKFKLKQPTNAHIFFIIILFYPLNLISHSVSNQYIISIQLLISEGCDSPYYCFGRCALILPTIADVCADGQCRYSIPPYFTTPRPYAILWWFNKVLVLSLIFFVLMYAYTVAVMILHLSRENNQNYTWKWI